MLTVLETLGPTERAVFVLREVFEMPYDEIAEAVGKPAATVRQIARRAREYVSARRPRVRVSPSEHRVVVDRFLIALREGQVHELMEVMAPDVVLIADGGGLAPAALAPIHGAELVATFLARADRVAAAIETTTVSLNGVLAARVEIDGQVAAVSLVVENGRVTRIYAVADNASLCEFSTSMQTTWAVAWAAARLGRTRNGTFAWSALMAAVISLSGQTADHLPVCDVDSCP